ncbi:MAG: hypothetical protein ACQERD_00955 [Campylobacterota bacterium]
MWNMLLTNVVLPLAVETVKSYVKNSDSKKDDKVLDVVQTGANYLSKKDNNTVDKNTSNLLNKNSMVQIQRSL